MKEMETRGDAKDASVNERSNARLVSVGPDRIKAFSDGVFAIALTLLILQVKVPSPSQITGEADLQSFLLQQWPAYLSYALSVVIIGLYWVAHHGLFHYIRRANRMLLWLNILFLLCVTFIPFPAALMSEFGNYRTSVVIYGASLAVTGLVFDLMRWYATHQHRLVDKDLHTQVIRTARRRNLIDPIRARVLEAQVAMQASLEDEEDENESYEPFEVDFKTVGEFYHKIETGFTHIPEEELFIGPPEAQANARFVDLNGDMVAIVDRASACAAIERIVEQGEAPTSAHPDAHFWVFDNVRTQYAEAMAQAEQTGIPFEPVRPVVANPMTHFYDDTSGGIIIHDPLTHEVADLFNVAYDTMLLILLRFFAHTQETEAELEHLSRATLRLMTTVIRPLGEALTKLPVDRAALPGRTAGPGFGQYRLDKKRRSRYDRLEAVETV